MNWSGMYTLFTELPSEIRGRVLPAIADPTRKIITHRWCEEEDGCLFSVAAAAAQGVTVKAFYSGGHLSSSLISIVLGLSKTQVTEGISLWDYGTDHERETFRRWIRDFLEAGQLTTQVELAPASMPEPEEELVGAGHSLQWKQAVKAVVLAMALPCIFGVIVTFG